MTFGQLQGILDSIGLKRQPALGTHTLYTHKASETTILLRAAQPEEVVPEMTVRATGHMLIGKGVLSAERWETLVQAPPV